MSLTLVLAPDLSCTVCSGCLKGTMCQIFFQFLLIRLFGEDVLNTLTITLVIYAMIGKKAEILNFFMNVIIRGVHIDITDR